MTKSKVVANTKALKFSYSVNCYWFIISIIFIVVRKMVLILSNGNFMVNYVKSGPKIHLLCNTDFRGGSSLVLFEC